MEQPGIQSNPILNRHQKTLLAEFMPSALANEFYLSGGTALAAFHLSHRISEDLDFFTSGSVPVVEVEGFLSRIPGVQEKFFERRYDRYMYTLRFADGERLKVQFDHYPFEPLEAPGRPVGGTLRVDGLRDLFVNKLHALSERVEPKDFVDLYHIHRRVLESSGIEEPGDTVGVYWEKGLSDFERKFGLRGATYIVQTGLARVKELRGLPVTTPPIAIDDLVRFVERQLRAMARSAA